MNISNVQSIKELKCMKANALAAYHAYARQCDERVEEIRNYRGQKLKAPEYSPYYEEGRSRARSNPHALEGDM
jgi:hypothetical protein|tara:strand:- start:166 stop:384 length:219 start_codon:yes stop_codon:yes gene_type:complete